jgi:hypothetical protein
MSKSKFAVWLLALGVLVGVPSTALAAPPDPSTLPASAQQAFESDRTIPTPTQVTLPDGKKALLFKAKQVSSRKATQQEVSAGLAASTATTVYNCVGTSGMQSPNGYYDGKLGWKAAWQEWSGPYARVNTGNAMFVFSNHTDGAIFRFTGVDWRDGGTHTDSYPKAEAGITPYNNPRELVYDGGQSGISVNSDGTTAAPWETLKFVTAGFRQSVLYRPSSWNEPEFKVRVWNYYNTAYADSVLQIRADGNCGSLAFLPGVS